MGKIYWINADGTEEVVEEEITSGQANGRFMEFMKLAQQRFDGNYAEMVWVWHGGQKTLMLTDEFGALPIRNGYPLPVNQKATEIYHAAARLRGQNWKGAPYIHGPVLLFEGITIR